MSRPTHETTAGRVYLALQRRARVLGRPTDELFVLYILERFLFRLGQSEHQARLVLKGGMLLAAFDERRPTADVDLLAAAMDNDVTKISEAVRAVAAMEVDDGVVFEPEGLRAEVIREVDAYTGVRVTMPASLGRARHPLRVDVNVGDPVTPAPVEIAYPSLLGDSFTVVGYPLETVLAEKVVTMIERGDTTTRERDFADVYLLTRHHAVDAATFAHAVRATAAHRQAELRPLRDALVVLATVRQDDWTRFLKRSGLEHQTPATYAEAIDAVAAFADPVLTGEITTGSWQPAVASWSTR